jgi:hypothetical protein
MAEYLATRLKCVGISGGGRVSPPLRFTSELLSFGLLRNPNSTRDGTSSAAPKPLYPNYFASKNTFL